MQERYVSSFNFQLLINWSFLGLARFSESILDYIANIESAPYPDITLNRFYGEIFSAFDVLFNVWMKSNEAKVLSLELACWIVYR